MKKVFLALLCVLTLILAGCGGEKPPTTSHPVTNPPTTTTSPPTTTTLPPTTTTLPPTTTVAFPYPNAAKLGAGLEGKVQAGFKNPVTSSVGTSLNVTVSWAVKNTTSSQTMTGYSFTVAIKLKDGTIVIAPDPVTSQVSIPPGLFAESKVLTDFTTSDPALKEKLLAGFTFELTILTATFS